MDLRAWFQSGKRPAPTAPTSPSPSKQAKAEAVEAEVPFSKDKAKELLAMEEFKDQPLEVKSKGIYCRACKAEIGCEARVLRQHCFQNQKVAT